MTDDEESADDGEHSETDVSMDEDGLDDDVELIATPQRPATARTDTSSLPSRDASPPARADEAHVDRSEPTTPNRVNGEVDVFMSPSATQQSFPPTPRRFSGSATRSRRRQRTKVIVTDASYRTYRSLLYYLYTDQIAFAPLASIFFERREAALANGEPWRWSSRSAWVKSLTPALQTSATRPSDAKAVFAVADKLMMPELKSRAFEHIKRSLSPSIVALEVFSSFSARFPEIQQLEIQVLLQNWPVVRASPAMKRVIAMTAAGQGNWAGYQDVWHHILGQLDYRGPSVADSPSASF